MIEWRQNAPKWVQIAEVLKRRIADGTYPVDSLLPSQHQMVAEFGVSDGTARKVITRLRDDGTAYTVPGLGTFVAGPSGKPADE